MSPARELADQKGFIFQEPPPIYRIPPTLRRSTQVVISALFIALMGRLAVSGNSDTSPSQGQGSLLAHAFLYDVAQQRFSARFWCFSRLSKATRLTASGTTAARATPPTAAVGAVIPRKQFRRSGSAHRSGYLVDYDSASQTFTHWTTFQYPFRKNFFHALRRNQQRGKWRLHAKRRLASSRNDRSGAGFNAG